MSDPADDWARPYLVDEHNPPPQHAPRALHHVWADNITVDLDDTGLVDGLIPRRGLTVLYGESNSGKTFWAIDLAARIGLGLPFYGLEVEAGIVVYVAAEAPESVKRRVLAWMLHHRVEHLPVLVITEAVDLMLDDTDAVIALARQEAGDRRIALLVVDTVATTMRGDENKGEDMGTYIGNVADMGSALCCHVLLVHHCGKDTARGARGWSGLRAATDVELECCDRCVSVTKLRDGTRKGDEFPFELVDVEIGRTSKGAVVQTAVAVPTDAPPPPRRAVNLTDRQKVVFDCLGAAMVDCGQTLPRARDIPAGTRGVALVDWQEAARRYLPEGPTNRQREAMMRCVEALQAKGLCKHVDGWCWVPG